MNYSKNQNKENYLILDVSLKTQLIILTQKKKILDTINFPNYKKFVENTVPLIDQILKNNNFKLKDLNGIIVGKGPGSFIGTRIAILTAKIISSEINIPLYKISSLILLSSGYIKKNKITPKIYAYENFHYGISFNENKIVLKENIYENSFLNKFENHLLLNSNNIKISLSTVFLYTKQIKNPHKLIPSYYDKKY
ncbi:MAG: tRNA (adenosine(37)-N6)-threonylcarbamoyltransferase complex dimerization subunit type 1 [Candidatus Phytoplasma cynodontis]|uniref:tRNA (adenosine(37)-N6)-threonylcarbamoyltransferase complex dimerization subunit type 1 TsaB n=1 Tax='Cynodon dactylon' phytoplasma TaxID=295320 RepID=UPI001265C990|nr:tRNA (adenosine(37)-N6)-threonylcarbamoyltransferase complex dimerization subunit type 1 TsaB ['Cynodon dactylon' phytoplasma]KAB8121873.1 tRNA (adenosine(37)-N6)-threonylcarbamoyltransferase complex dimerization subunit type 1 TsaB ['Cynodon dactylon' phytoplasma]WIA07802.1 MAG: tRNA (adenosine(37)-N6)-threonylcarbamoyltransferase complex dimerization subunit type 1 [Candidatus Phytoplasma cynodontis]